MAFEKVPSDEELSTADNRLDFVEPVKPHQIENIVQLLREGNLIAARSLSDLTVRNEGKQK